MTDKPKQVTNNGYTGNGYEILATNRGNNQDGYVSAIKRGTAARDMKDI